MHRHGPAWGRAVWGQAHSVQGVTEKVWRRWWFRTAVAALAFAIAVGLGTSVWMALQTHEALAQVAQIDDPRYRLTAYRELAQFQLDVQVKIWTAIVQAVGAVVIGVGGYFTWRNVRVGQDTLRVAQENLRVGEEKLKVDREAQITNRFTQAVAQLGAELKEGQPNLEVRLGGIYALERISRDWPPDHGTIMEILTAYVRQNAHHSTPPSSTPRTPVAGPQGPASAAWSTPRVDIQAILTVLGRRAPQPGSDEPGLDLTGADLRGANLRGANLKRARFEGTNLQGAKLIEANLQGAMFLGANLKKAALSGANLQGARLVKADLREAQLSRADLQGAWLVDAELHAATLSGANLRGGNLERAHLRGGNLDGADLRESVFVDADLQGARFSGANMQGTALSGADLQGAILTWALNLTDHQVQLARDGGKGALLPRSLTNTTSSAPPPEDLARVQQSP